LCAVKDRRVPRGPLAIIAEPAIEGRIDCEARVAQRAIGGGRIEPGPEAGEAARRESRGGAFGGRQIRSLRHADEAKRRQKRNPQPPHGSP